MTKKKMFGMKWLAAVCLLSVCMSSASAKNGADDVGQPGTPIDDNGGNGGGSDDVGFDDKGGNTPGDDNGGNAGGNGSGGGNGASDQRMRLRIGNDRTNEFSSKVEYRVKKGLARIKGTVKLWLPDGAGTGLDSATASDALITATFLRGAPYAECEFTFNRIVDGRIAEYVFTSRQTGKLSSPRLRVQKGSCDIDLGTGGLQAGIPGALANDRVEIVLHDEANSGHIDLGSGKLKAK